ncbi:MAG: TatD family hydrolase [Desulfobacteraceae bacterium]|nr:TatD family hydrolase [Desulfobacteraceae bacterium]
MKIFDSHCHLDDQSFAADVDQVLDRAASADVRGIMIAGINEESSRKALDLAKHNAGVIAAVGVHPHKAQSCNTAILERMKAMAKHPEIRAWGEIGLDYNRMFSPRKDQEKWFLAQLDMADELDLPLIFHERDTNGRFLELLQAHPKTGRKAVVHCFSGNKAELDAYVKMGFHIGITGILTIKSRGAELRRMVKEIPLDRLLVETDAPYLTPTPERNKFRRNEPAFVRTVLFKLAEVRQEPVETLADEIWQNTNRLFGCLSAGIQTE